MVLTKSEVLQIDSTIIIGIFILLSITTITDTDLVKVENTILPEGWNNPIFLVVWVIGAFSVSALLEISFMLYHSLLYYKSKNSSDDTDNLETKHSIHTEIPDSTPKYAAPASLIAMAVGFIWLTVTVIIFAADAFFAL